jgi:hypothetical protein
MLGADSNLWVVKFQNNPQHLRVLANEFIATRLAAEARLTVPPCDVIEVSEWLIANTPEMMVELGGGRRERCATGLQFGSRFVGGLMPGQVIDYMPEQDLGQVRNLEEFAGMLCIDKWTGNTNGRQAVFERRARERRYRATFIDQGYCFGAGEWKFSDAPLRGVYLRNRVYANVTGWQSFEPWLTRVEEMRPEALWRIAEEVPPEWYGGNMSELEQLMEQLLKRRGRVRELIASFRDSNRNPFPLWNKDVTVALAEEFVQFGSEGKFVM